MIITPTNNAFFVTSVMEPRFWTAYGVAEEWASKIATPYPIEGLQWVSAWMGMLDKYREWLGPRKTRQPAPQTYLVPVKDWELTEEIDEFRLMDSTAATAASYYGPTAAFMGMQGKKLWDYIKANGMQDATNKRAINADAKLKAVFGKDQVTMFELAGIVGKHLRPVGE